jgi:hypothetical protein
MSFVDEGGARARVRALVCINRDLPEKRLRAALVAPDNTIIKILERPDFQGRTVCSPLNPAEGVRIEPPFEEGRVCIWRASLDEWYSTHPATPAAAADRLLAPEADAAPTPGAEVEPEGSPSTTQQTVAEPTPAASVELLGALNPGDAQPQPRASRQRRNQGSGPQRRRARVVLKRLWPKEYPTEEEVSNVDLLDRFAKEYEKVEGKANPPSRLKMPSPDTVLREVGRKD